jgi:hypothetical protein
MLREIGASQMERLPTDSEILSMVLNDMASLGLIEFRADAKGGGCWVVRRPSKPNRTTTERPLSRKSEFRATAASWFF